VLIELPVTRRILVRRVEYGMVEEGSVCHRRC
jgi:hypothetical protein